MRILVVGVNGLLGSNVVDKATIRGWETLGTYHTSEPKFSIPLTPLDIRDTDEFEELLDGHSPDAVINCAAMTDVDHCEKNPEQARHVNGEAPGSLAAACDEREIRFVHISTDYIFNGKDRDRYPESADPDPIQSYGRSKLTGERTVRDVTDEALIARLSFVYGIQRDTGELAGFPAWVRRRLRNGESTPLFVDQRFSPSRAGQVAGVLLDLLERETTGIYHVASRSCVTPFQFGDEVRARMSADASLLEEGSQSDVERPAARPEYSCLDVSRLQSELGREQPTLQEDLDVIAGVFC